MRIRLGRSRPAPLPPELDQPEVLAFIAAMLAWRDGDPVPQPPKQLTMSVPDLMAELARPEIRAGVVARLAPLVRKPNRAELHGTHRSGGG